MHGQDESKALRILRLKHVQERLGLGRSTIYDRINPKSLRYDSTFPKPISLGGAAVGWIDADINNWINLKKIAGVCAPSISNEFALLDGKGRTNNTLLGEGKYNGAL